MVETDYHAIYRLYRQLVGNGNCREEFTRIFQSFFESKEREAYVADVHQQVIGFVTLYYFDVLHRGGQVASIQELVVTEEFQGRGVGWTLLNFVKEKLPEKKCCGLEVATDLLQSGARSFYQKCGLREESRLAVN
jgi:ribosomal protein S18 acetylase RimI-like enzyme